MPESPNERAASPVFGHTAGLLIGLAILLGLLLTSFSNFLLFHVLIEIFTVAIAGGIFMVAWNSRRLLDNNYLLFVGITYLFVGFIDLVHALAYKNMGVFAGIDANVPTQLWIAARYLQSFSLLAAPLFLQRRFHAGAVIAAYGVVVAVVFAAIFSWQVFPDCFIEGQGLTPFKKGSEYVIALFFLGALILLRRKRHCFDPRVLRLLKASIVILIFSELAFTFYVSVFGLSNLVGHFGKGIAFYLIYKAIIETALTRPYDLLFRELKLSEERYRLLYNETPVMLHSIDGGGRLTNVSNFWLDYLGYERDEVIGRKSTDFFTAESCRYAQEVVLPEFFVRGHVKDVPYRVVKKNGEVIDVLLSATAERDGSGAIARSLAVMADVTERKRAAETIEALNADLEERANELEASNCELEAALSHLEATNRELEEANQELDAFNHTIAHDVRSPLNGIVGFCDLMLAETGRLDAEQRTYVEYVRDAALHIAGLSKTLLDFSRLSRCEMRRERTDLSEMAAAIATELKLHDPARQVTFSLAEGLTAEADPSLLRIVLQNLLGNAWKYTGKRDKAVIRFGTTESGGRPVFFVGDNGHGFAMEHAENLFRPFYRLASTSEFPGHGIGLATVHRIIHRHGGRVWGEGEPGKGATFFFTLQSA